MTPAMFEAGEAEAPPVWVLVAAEEVELPALETDEVLVVIETTGEVVGAAVIILPLELVTGDEEESVVECACVEDVVSDIVVVVAAILPFGPYPGR